ncbi:lysine-specific demethylase JMJ25 isoform X1 [Tanacetum coccineum]
MDPAAVSTPVSGPGPAEDNNGIPDDLRCKRSDGKQWRCHAMSMPDKTVCEKHYIQAKKRAANSAMRASLKRAKRTPTGESDSYLESKSDDMDSPLGEYPMTASGSRSMEMLAKRQISYSPETPSFKNSSVHISSKSNDDLHIDMAESAETPRAYMTPSSVADSSKSRSEKMHGAMTETSDGNSESANDTSGKVCHQCRRYDRHNIVWCLKCDRRGYPDMSAEEVHKICPTCRGFCTCKMCLRGDNMIKGKIRDIPAQEKLEHLFRLLSLVLPVVKQVHFEQCSELELEKKLRGNRIELPRMKLNVDEQMCCDFCRIPIIDYHRHCGNCSYDICLRCCQDVRKASKGRGGAEVSEMQTGRLNIDGSGNIPYNHKGDMWLGNSALMLKRIFKMNWVAKLVKNADEMVSGCKMCDIAVSRIDGLSSRLCQYAGRENSDDNFLYAPSCYDIKGEGIVEFRKQWMKGVPVIVKEVCDESSVLGWDPMVMWKGIRETTNERMKDDNRVVKAIDCFDRSEVDIELGQFIKGYTEGRMCKDNRPEMLLLKNWPSPGASEEFLSYQRPEFISKLPLLEYIHSKWGFLNLAARLPHYSLQNDVGPKIMVSYGMSDELGQGDSVTMLHVNMRDVVYLLVHTCEVKTKRQQTCKDLGESEAAKSPPIEPESLDEPVLPKSPIAAHNMEKEGEINIDSIDNDRTESQGISASVNTSVATTSNTENGGDTNIDKMEDDRTESDGELNIDFEEDRTEMDDDRTDSDDEITIYFEEDISHRTESQGVITTMNTTIATTNETENNGETCVHSMEDDRTESHGISTTTPITATNNVENDGETNIDLMEDDRTENQGTSTTTPITATNNVENDGETNLDLMKDDRTESQGIRTTPPITTTNNVENDGETNIDLMKDDRADSHGISTTTPITTTSIMENKGETNMDLMKDDGTESQVVSKTTPVTTTNNMKNDRETNIDLMKDDRSESRGISTTMNTPITTTDDEKVLKCEDLNKTCEENFNKSLPGAIWDIFRREDVPKLIEYTRLHSNEFGIPDNIINDSVQRPLHEGVIFLNSDHKRKLKEEFGVEPWTIEQHLGVAVFIPTGCPFQVRNLQSSVQLGLDFLFPESLAEAVRLAGEIRELPNDHDAKLQILEAGKISLYAASSAIKEVQRLVLDPKFSAELAYEDPNLTKLVSVNLEKMTKQRQVTCA